MDWVPRDEWGFAGPLGPAMTLPSRGCWLHHSVTNPTRDPHADARTLERIGKQRFGRLSYSWIIHPTGVVLQGQGNHIGAHTARQNSTSHGIVVIGNYETDPVPDVVVDAAADLLRFGHRAGWWRSATLLGGHRDTKQTTCPGRHLYQLIPAINRAATAVEEEDVPTFIKKSKSSPDIYEVHGGYLVKVVNSVVFNYIKRGALVDDNPPAEVKNLPVLDPAARASGGLSQSDADDRYAPLKHPHSGFSKNGHEHAIVSGTVK